MFFIMETTIWIEISFGLQAFVVILLVASVVSTRSVPRHVLGELFSLNCLWYINKSFSPSTHHSYTKIDAVTDS